MHKPAKTIKVERVPPSKRFAEVFNVFACWGRGKRARRLLSRYSEGHHADRSAAKIALALGLSLYINNKGTKIAV